MLRVHLDTDIGGDADDLAALALLLGSESVELVAVTTCIERDGMRAARARSALALGGRAQTPVEAGPDTLFDGSPHACGLQDVRYWPDDARWRQPTSAGAAARRLIESIEAGATVVAIGPLTNLALAERRSPGILRTANVVVMGGYTERAAPGLPQWGPEMNFNFEADRAGTQSVFEACDPLIVPLHVCMPVAIRAAHLAALQTGGPLSRLVARHSQLQAQDNRIAELAAAHPGLPPDILNFQWDPVACAAALGWESVQVGRRPLVLQEGIGGMVLAEHAGAPERRLVTGVDAERFSAGWLDCVQRV